MKIVQWVQEIWSGHESVKDGMTDLHTKGIPIAPVPLRVGGLKIILLFHNQYIYGGYS